MDTTDDIQPPLWELWFANFEDDCTSRPGMTAQCLLCVV